MVRDLVIEVEPAEPSVGKMQFNLLGQPAFRTQAIAVPNDEHPDHQLGVDRRPPNLAVVGLQLRVHVGKSRGHKEVNAPQKVVLRDPIVEPELVE